jgi:23S rRNA (cytosine1962-C5)-methyltransferase
MRKSVYSSIILKKGKEEPVLRKHPWIFSGAIAHSEGEVQAGDIVAVLSHDRKLLGYGLLEEGSIAVKMISFGTSPIEKDFWQKKFETAFSLRKALGLTNNSSTTAYRFINSEGDGMPGLVADYYNGVMVFQAQSTGMQILLHTLAESLLSVYPNHLKAIYSKPAEYTNYSVKNNNLNEGFLWGNAENAVIKENGFQFEVDFMKGQKTGFFLDQRENREMMRKYAIGRSVLNCFCYTGAFSVYAFGGGAIRVDSVDSSGTAIENCERNLQLNGFDAFPHSCIKADALKYLDDMKEEYDLIILDPPAFAKHSHQKANAVRAYRHINRLAIRKAKPGSFLFTFSCSQVIDSSLFSGIILSAAIEAEREVKLLHHLTQGPDHPVSIFHPEGEYLKGILLYIF